MGGPIDPRSFEVDCPMHACSGRCHSRRIKKASWPTPVMLSLIAWPSSWDFLLQVWFWDKQRDEISLTGHPFHKTKEKERNYTMYIYRVNSSSHDMSFSLIISAGLADSSIYVASHEVVPSLGQKAIWWRDGVSMLAIIRWAMDSQKAWKWKRFMLNKIKRMKLVSSGYSA